jgi:hypothetical protein
MSSSGALAAGTTSYSSTTATGTADTVTFQDRYGYVTVTNESTSGVLSVRTDGQAATETSGVPGVNCYAVGPGETQVFANARPLWFQSSRVIPQGSNQFGSGNAAASPGSVTPMESLAGQMANPGTSVSIISSAAVQYTVAAAG